MSVMLEKEDRSEELLTENASTLKVKEDGVEISSLFDPPQVVPGVRVVRIDFMNNKVFLANC
ncbi:MAG: CooT family nickel-binding protein [Desulfurivibrionaceae bacterium]|nr:CooT family nickel-binding protein [Desulfobulbales bacterium]MDT8335755.1 CooT family nickel-binding protein [Desulfurivibrionaceae bacterium]